MIGKCQFCGTALTAADPARSIPPARTLPPAASAAGGVRQLGRVQPVVIRQAKRPSLVPIVLGFLVASTLIVAVGFAIRFGTKSDVDELEEPSAAPESTHAPYNLNGVVLDEGLEVDPTDLLAKVRQRIGPRDAELRLLRIEVTGARDGLVDLRKPGARIVYRYDVIVREGRGSKRQSVEMTLNAENSPIRRMPAAPFDRSIPEPTCVWSAAWRAARASGLPSNGMLDAIYEREEGRKGMWVFTVPEHPEQRCVLDGHTCAIRTR